MHTVEVQGCQVVVVGVGKGLLPPPKFHLGYEGYLFPPQKFLGRTRKW